MITIRTIVVSFYLLNSSLVCAQPDSTEYTDGDFLYQEQAEFPGGNGELFKFIKENICYPDSAKSKGIEGKVFVSFIVDSTGKVSDPIIKRGMGEEFDTLVIQMINAMPKWKPSMIGDKPVKQRYTLPVPFKLTGSSSGNSVSAISCEELRKKRKTKK